MSSTVDGQTLVIPSGFQLQAEEDGFSIGNQGDVVIRGKVSFHLNKLFSSEGSVRLESTDPLNLTRVEAPNGDVVVSGPIHIQTLVARRVDFKGGSLTVRELVADQEVRLGGDSLQADVILAPRVEISPKLKGRATVIESKNEIGPNLLKGGFRLAEYLEIFPSGTQLLNQYPEVQQRMEGWQGVVALQASSFDPVAGSGPGAAPASASSAVPAAAAVLAAPVAPIIEPSGGQDEEEELELGTGEVENDVLILTDAEAIKAAAPAPRADSENAVTTEEDLYQRLSDGFIKIISCYSDIELPPPLSTLEGLIEDRRFDDLKKQLNGLWNELLQFHKREGMHIANAVTHNIQEMKRLVSHR